MLSERVDIVRVAQSIRRLRIAYVARESMIQGEIAAQLSRDGIPCVREHKLGPRAVIDLFVPGAGIGIEVKKGKPSSTRIVMKQVERYSKFAAIKGLIIVVEGKLEEPASETQNGKRVVYIGLAKLWGVAV